MGAVHRLGFHRRVPPRVQQENVFGGGEVQAQAAGLQADQEEPALRVVLEALHVLLPVSGGAVQVLVDRTVLVQAVADNRQQAGELRKHQRLVALVQHLAQLFQQHFQLGAGVAKPFRIEQAGVTGGLAQPQQRFQNLDLRFRQPIRFDALEQRVAVVLPQIAVKLLLRRLHFAEYGLLGLEWKLAGHLLLGAPQDERPQRLRQKPARILVGSARRATRQLEYAGRSKHARIEEFEEAPQLAQVVLDKLQRVAPQRSVGSHDRVISRETVAGARQASVIEHAQLRREARGFLHPVEDQRLGDHHQGWP